MTQFPKSQASEHAAAIHNALSSVTEVYGRTMAGLIQENEQLRGRLALVEKELATLKHPKEASSR